MAKRIQSYTEMVYRAQASQYRLNRLQVRDEARGLPCGQGDMLLERNEAELDDWLEQHPYLKHQFGFWLVDELAEKEHYFLECECGCRTLRRYYKIKNKTKG